MSDSAPSIALHLPQLDIIEAKLEAVLEGRPEQAWYTLEQACRLKYGSLEGGVSLQTIRNTLALQPCGGIPDGWQSGRKAWTPDSVEEWLLVNDLSLADYLKKHNLSVRVPDRIIHANERHRRDFPSVGLSAHPEREAS